MQLLQFICLHARNPLFNQIFQQIFYSQTSPFDVRILLKSMKLQKVIFFSSIFQFYILYFLFIFFMKVQQITQTLIYAFHLEAIADSIHFSHVMEMRNKKKQQQSLNVQYILSEDGRPIIQLFGYHLAHKLAGRTFDQMRKVSNQVLFNEESLTNYCLTFWPDMGKYQLVIPVLFRILKCRQVVTPKTMDLFLEVCKKQISPFMAEIKQNTPASQLKKFCQKLNRQCEKQDLLNTGFIEKNIIQQLYKVQIKNPLPDWPKQLYNQNNVNQLNYKMLLGPKYLGVGKNIQNFLLAKFLLKIIRILKRAGKILKNKGNRKQGKKRIIGRMPLKPSKTTEKANKNQKYLKQYIEQNKIKKTQQNKNRNKFIVRSIIQQIIGSVVQIKYNEGQQQINRAGRTTKSVYVAQPQYPQIEYDEQNIKIKKLKFVGNNDLGFFVSGSRGYLMDNIRSVKKSEIQLNISHAFKDSPIIQYQVLNNLLYLLKENGLLYSWAITGDTFLNQVQTSFQKPLSPPNSGFCNFLRIKDGIIAVNCTHNLYSRIELYSLELSYIGVVELNQLQNGIDYKMCQQSKILLRSIKKVTLDKKIKQLKDIQSFVKQKLHESYYRLSAMVVKSYNGEQFALKKLQQYLLWVESFKIYNQISLPSSITEKLKSQKDSKQLIQYLLKLGYITEGKSQQVQNFVKQMNIKNIPNRKKELLTLFEDNSLQPITQPFLTKEQFIIWVRPACLMDLQLKQLLQSLQYRPDGKVDMSKLFYNQHYRRINDSKSGRFNPDNYKCEESPPVCVKQFIHIPSFQIVVFSTCFPIYPKIYVVNMINGNLLNSYDLSKCTSIPPKINICDKNGYVFVIAGRSISLWNSFVLSQQKQLNPIKNWVNIQSSQIIDMGIIYQQSTLLTLTKDAIKIWDFNQICKKRQNYNTFKIKPGYRAVQNTTAGTGAKNYKKKIFLRQNAQSLYHFVTANESIVAGAVSLTKNNRWYIKSFAVNKFNIVINSQKQFYQIPTKLLRELQMIALKRKSLPPVTRQISSNQCEKAMLNRIAGLFKQKLRIATQVKVSSDMKPQLQRKILLLSNTLSSIYNRSMFKDHQPQKRLQNIFKIITLQNIGKLEQILQKKFMDLYRYEVNNQFRYNIDEMLQDCMSTKQKKIVNRVLYVLSLIEKFTRPIAQMGSKIAKLISEDRINLSQNLILSVLPKGLPPDSRVITKVVRTINNLSQPVNISIRIIQNNLPSRYRFLVPRYIKQIVSGKQSSQLNEYMSNRYEYEPRAQQIKDKIMSNNFDGVQSFIEQSDLLKFVKDQVIPSFPLALNCNYSLIQALMCLKVISQNQAFYFCVQESNRPQERLSAKFSQIGELQQQKVDEIIDKIHKNIQKKKITLPEPKISYEYFKNQLYSEDNSKNFFYGFLNGDRSEQQIFTQKLQICLRICSKKLRLKYRLSQWQWIMGQKIMPLKLLVNEILQRFPIDYRILSVVDLKTALMSMIQSQNIYNDLIRRICYSCTSSQQKLKQWTKFQGTNAQTEGMWVNINHLLRYIQDYNPSLLQLQNSRKIPKQPSIKIPSYSILQKLSGDSILLPITKFRQMLTLNISALTLTQMEETVHRYYKHNMKKISIFDIRQLMPKDLSVVGRMLIDRYHRMQFQNRFTVVSQLVNSIQIVQLFGSKLLSIYLFGDQYKGLPQFVPMEKVTEAIKKHLILPAANKMSIQLALALPKQILQLLEDKAKKSDNLPVITLTQLVNHKNYDQAVVASLLKFLSSQSDSAQIINITILIQSIRKIVQQHPKDAYQLYRQNLTQKIKNRNIIQLFLQKCQPQNFPFVQQDSPKSYILTHEHMQQIMNGQCQWFINSRPFAKIGQFIDHVRFVRKQDDIVAKTVAFFTQNCVYKVGINQIGNIIGSDPSFVQFYNRLRSNFKILAKFQTRAFIYLYKQIIKCSQNNKCDINGMKNMCQVYISVTKKTEWICALYDKQLIDNPLQQEQLTLDCQLKIQKLKNLIYENENTQTALQKLKKSLKYHEYLLHRYLANDISKMRQIYLSIQDKKLQDAKNMLQIYGVNNQLHIKQIIKYIELQFKDHDHKRHFSTEDFSVEQLKLIIKNIKQNPKILNNSITQLQSSQLPQVKNQQIQTQSQQFIQKINKSKIYEQFKYNGGVSQYYSTYHTFLQFCQSLLQAKLANNNNIISIRSRIRDFLIRNDMTAYKLFELLDLSTYDNIIKYLPECTLQGTQSPSQIADIIKIIAQLAKPQRNGIRYPINSYDFYNMLLDRNRAIGKDRKQYQYLYNQLDLLGIGYVNLNDLGKYRGTCPGYMLPYVYIPDYIDYISKKDNAGILTFPSTYTGPILPPPSNKQLRNRIKQKLLKYQLPVRNTQKTKLIQIDICFAVLSQFAIAQDHQYRQFIRQKFMMKSNGFLDLSGVVDWIQESLVEEKEEYSHEKNQEKVFANIQDISKSLEDFGGIHAYLNTLMTQQHHQDLQKLLKSLTQLQISQLKPQIQKLSQKQLKPTEISQLLTQVLKQIVQKYFKQVRKWHTFNNHFYRQIKNMAQTYYTLVYKFYQVHNNIDMHYIYQSISQNGMLTLNSLWQYIENKGITGYSRADINQLYMAIDLNSDKQLSYFEFCQFWMACQQIFCNLDTAQYQFNKQIDKINIEVKDIFLQLCSIELNNSYQQIMGIDDIVRFTNIPNVQKVDYIARAVNNSLASGGPKSGAFDCKIQLRKSKLKIMMQKMKKNQATHIQNTRVNLILLATQPDIYQYVKQGYNSQSLNKIILAKYPKFGYEIVQHFHDLCQMDPQKLQEKYQETKQISLPPAKTGSSRQQKLKLVQGLINNIQELYRKNAFKIVSYQHKEFGNSIASGLLGQHIRNSLTNINKQLRQMYNFIKKFQQPNVPVYYQLQPQHQHYFPTPQKIKSLQDLSQYHHQTTITHTSRPLFEIQEKIYSHKPFKPSSVIDEKSDDVIWREIVWRDTDFVCKSQSKVNILQYAHLYSDPEISLIPINVDNSNRFRIQGAYLYRPQYHTILQMTPNIITLQQQKGRDQLIDRVMSLIKLITQKLIYCYYKYSMTGLLLLPENILINIQNNQDIKFNNFISVILLNQAAIKNKQQNVNYVDGIDSKFLINDQRPYPPQVKLGIHTEAMDVFMLIHIVYGIYRQYLNPDDRAVPEVSSVACEEETLWGWSSPLHQISSRIINSHSQKQLTQKQYNLWTLFYQCSSHDWFLRPRLYQLHQVVQNYFGMPDTAVITDLFAINNKIQEVMVCLHQGKIADALQKLNFIPKEQWNLEDIIKFREVLQIFDKIDTTLLQNYNSILQNYMKFDHAQTQPQRMRIFMSNCVDYLLMINPTNSGQCSIANATFKNILNDIKIKRYLFWCDENWKINQYQINKKIQKINMNQKLQILHKNSSFYHDIATLAECRVTLAENQSAKRNDTSKKVAISFIHSCLISNNINKIYAVYRSEILKNIYSFVGRDQLQALVISLFQICTSCFNPMLVVNRYRAVDQVYKVMMVISNSIITPTPTSTKQPTQILRKPSSTSSVLKSSKFSTKPAQQPSNKPVQTQSVVSMKDFVNNYYTITGQQCRQMVLIKICKQQLCILPVLTYIMNQVDIGKLNKIIINICYDEQIQKIMRSPVVGGYSYRLKQAKMDNIIRQIKQAITIHTQSISLAQLSTSPIQQQNFVQLVHNHIKYYRWYIEQTKRRSQQNPIAIAYQRNFHTHYQSFLAKTQHLFDVQINYVQVNQLSLHNVCMIIKAHKVMFDVWTRLPSHPDFTAGTLRFLMKALQVIQNDNNIYMKSKVNSETTPDILDMLRRFWMRDDSPSTHDLAKIALDNGFIQFYCRIVRRQYELMKLYIEKNVQNIHMTDNYHPEAQFRIICFYLFLQNKRFTTEICQMMIANQFPSFIVDKMLHSTLILDLRFYKANDQLVPFRYCNPLRAQAITMIGFVLSQPDCVISDEISSRLIVWLPSEIKNITNDSLQTVPDRMKWVQSLWLLANITNSQNERLKYEFINLRLHQIISKQVDKYQFLNRFFPQMTQTLRNSQLMISSLARSQLIQ